MTEVYDKIIAGYGWSAQADDAVALAGRLARETRADVLVATVWYRQLYPSRVSPASFWDYLREDARNHAEEGAAKLASGVEGKPVAVPGTSAAAGLHDLAEREEADLVVIGSTAHGPIDRILLGTTGASLMQASLCAVAIAPRGFAAAQKAPARVLAVAYDGSPEADAALRYARTLAETLGSHVRVLTVVEPPDPHMSVLATGYGISGGYTYKDVHDHTRERRQAALDEALKSLPEPLHPRGTLLEGDPATALAAATQDGIDILVLGSRGYGPIRRVLLGSVSARLVRMAACPVLVVPRSAHVAAEAEVHATADVA